MARVKNKWWVGTNRVGRPHCSPPGVSVCVFMSAVCMVIREESESELKNLVT